MADVVDANVNVNVNGHPLHQQDNDDDDDDNDSQQEDLQNPQPMERWEALVTLPDWQGEAMYETWYGHHQPCRRLALFVHLSSFLATIMFVSRVAMSWPLYQFSTTPRDIEAMQLSHARCFQALCDVLEPIVLECEVTRPNSLDGFAKVIQLPKDENEDENEGENDDDWMDHVSLPYECLDAMERTFGLEWPSTSSNNYDDNNNNNNNNPSSIRLIQLQKRSKQQKEQDKDTVVLFELVHDECAVRETLLEGYLSRELQWGRNGGGAFLIDLLPPFPPSSFNENDENDDATDGKGSNHQPREDQESIVLPDEMRMGDAGWEDKENFPHGPNYRQLIWKRGDRLSVSLGEFVCPKYMSAVVHQEILAPSYHIYELAMEWRWMSLVLISYWMFMAIFAARSASRVFYLPIPALVLYWFLPRNEVRGQKISIFSIMSTILLLSTITSDDGDTLLTSNNQWLRVGVLITAALSFGNQTAALEWLFLFFLSGVQFSRLFTDSTTDDGSSSLSTWLGGDMLEEFFSFAWILDPLDSWDTWSKWIRPNLEDAIELFIPGFGLWKMVSIYVLIMAFPRPQQRQKRQNDDGEGQDDALKE